jgi:hypothetical protein
MPTDLSKLSTPELFRELRRHGGPSSSAILIELARRQHDNGSLDAPHLCYECVGKEACERLQQSCEEAARGR